MHIIVLPFSVNKWLNAGSVEIGAICTFPINWYIEIVAMLSVTNFLCQKIMIN